MHSLSIIISTCIKITFLFFCIFISRKNIINMVMNSHDKTITRKIISLMCCLLEARLFSTYIEVDDKHLYMENSSTFKVVGIKKGILKMTFEKLLTRISVLHVVNIWKNLVPYLLLSKNNFKMVFESGKFVLIKNEIFVGKWYLYDDLFKMNVRTIITKNKMNNNNNNTSSSYLLESCYMWHNGLKHVNYNSIQRLRHVELKLLPSIVFEKNISMRFV